MLNSNSELRTIYSTLNITDTDVVYVISLQVDMKLEKIYRIVRRLELRKCRLWLPLQPPTVYPGELSNYNSIIGGVKLKHKHHVSKCNNETN